MKRRWIVCCLLSLAHSLPLLAAEPARPADARLGWWRDARFGLFIHWGPVAQRGTEIGWSRGAQVPVEEYDRLYQTFDPVAFDAHAWVTLAREAGMKYLVFTSKHHDGFCMWDSPSTDYDIMSTPFQRDVVRELARACREQDLVFALYFSILDWRHPDYPLGSPGGRSVKPNADMNRYQQVLKQQLTELLTTYGPLGILWFDGEWEKPWTAGLAEDLHRHLLDLQPGLIINNRLGKGRAGMEGSTAEGALAGDYDTPEQRVGRFQTDRPWESCITLCRQWSWKPDDTMKSLRECVRTLVTCAGGDGNLLLNVGPRPDGRIEPRQAERLREMGRWLQQYGQSIYCTRGGPIPPQPWGVTTHAQNVVYLHILDWPEDSILLPGMSSRIRSAHVLTGGQAVLHAAGPDTRLEVAPEHRDPLDTIIRLELDNPIGD